MSNYTDVLLLVTLFDGDEKSNSNKKSNVDSFNDWLKEEWPDTLPQFEITPLAGVFVASVNNAADGSDIIDKFRSIPWFEPEAATLMLRKEGSDNWTTYKVTG